MRILEVNNRVINLEKVSTVKLDEVKGRIYFNMTFVTQNSSGIYIQDYVYVKYTPEILESIVSELNRSGAFIRYEANKWVNVTCISSMKLDEESSRIIMNLSNPHTYEFPHGKKVLAEFIYMENADNNTLKGIVEIMNIYGNI